MKNTAMCCREFPICNQTLEDFWINYEHYVLNEGSYPDPAGNQEIGDIHILAPMLLYRGFYKGPTSPEAEHHYTCKHLQSDSMCGIQDTKPEMCKSYVHCEHVMHCESEHCPCHPTNKG